MSPETIPQITETIPQVTESIQQTVSLVIDWNEIIYILVGAIIGFLASIIVLVVERSLDKKGKINIYYLRTNQRGMNGLGWGFDKSGDGRLYLTIPIVFELQNTSNTTRVIRDVSLLLYSGKTFVGKMYQLPGMHITKRTGSQVTGEKDYHFGSEKGSYSFVLPPRSIQRQECEYIFAIQAKDKEANHFDTIIARYYDEKNKSHTFKVMNIDNAWEQKHYDMDEEWLVLDEKVNLPPK